MKLLSAFAGLSFAIAAPAQSDSPADEIPPELVVPNDEARAYFATLETRPITGDVTEQAPTALIAFAEEYVARRLIPGEHVPGWREAAIDLAAVAAARPGGLPGNMIEASTPFGIQRTYFVDRPIEPLLPRGARLVAIDGPSIPEGTAEIDIARMSPKVIMVMRSVYRREGRLRCLHRTNIQFYSDPAREASMLDVAGVVSGMLLMRRMTASGICFGAEERESGAYVWRSFDSNGRRLPALDEGQPLMRIVSATDFSPDSDQ